MSVRQGIIEVIAFRTSLGWMALARRGRVVRQLTFGHVSRQAAIEALDPEIVAIASIKSRADDLVRRLTAMAAGKPVDFGDIEIDGDGLSEFQRRVRAACRRIPCGQTATYAQLAQQAGSAGAARAVGNCMAANRVPLLVPCHRVVAGGGGYGGFSAPGGIGMKKRLLAMERLAQDELK